MWAPRRQTGPQLYLYDTKTHSLTNLTRLVDAQQGYYPTPRHLLLIPDNLPDQIPAPEPAAWATFALLIGGFVAHRRFRASFRQGQIGAQAE